MTYQQIFERTFDRLSELGIEYTYVKSGRAREKAVSRAEVAVGFKLPTAFRAFYSEFSDGLNLYWSASGRLGSVNVPSLKELVGDTEIFRQIPRTPEKYDFMPRMGIERARAIAGRMEAWLPFDTDNAGNGLCIDCESDGGPVVYFEAAWFSGDGVTHGHILAPDFGAFLLQWSRVCFIKPIWWPGVFGGLEVGWDAVRFPAEFRL